MKTEQSPAPHVSEEPSLEELKQLLASTQEELARTRRELKLQQAEFQHQLSHQSQQLEEVRASDAFAQSEIRKLRWALEQATDGVQLTDLQGKIEFLNASFARLHGYTIDELHQQPIHILAAEGSERFKTQERKQWQQEANEEEIMRRRKDGSLFPVWCRSTPLFDEFARPIGILEIVRDITERKQYEKALYLSRLEAEKANQAKSDFLTQMSHEIRTPLNTILGMTQLTLETELTAEQRDFQRSVHVSAQALLDLINDLLDFSKLAAGKMELEPTPFSPAELMQSVEDILRLRAEMKGLQFQSSLDPYLPDYLEGDPIRLRQILLNLAGNAVKFTRYGSVSIHLEVMGHRFDEECGRMLYEMTFQVKDTGPGISKEDQSRIFEEYAQARQSPTTRAKGTGLGLSICQTLVNLMEGSLELESELGKGTTFYVRLQLPSIPATEIPRHILSTGGYIISDAYLSVAPSQQQEKSRQLRLLLVEDNLDNQKLARHFLKKLGLEVDFAENGQIAVDCMKEAYFDLVLMDLEMPVMDGFEATRKIRKMEKKTLRTPVPILTLTAHSQKEIRERSLEAGMDDFLFKPLQKSKLLNMVDRWVDRRKLLLIVDDNPDNRRLLYFYLKQSEDYKLLFACDGSEAVTWFERSRPDIVLMDLEMPVLNGMEAMRQIRRLPGGAEVPILALSAHQADATHRRCLEEGFNGYLQKPLGKRVLLNTISRYLSE